MLMVAGGIGGGMIGRRLRRVDDRMVERMFLILRDQLIQIRRRIFRIGDHRLSEVLDSQGLLCVFQLLLGGGEDKGITLF